MADFILSTSTYFADGDPTTAQLTQPEGYIFQAGKMGETSNPLPAIDLDTDKYTELEWCLKATSDVINGEVYEFRITINGDPLDSYLYIPRWTVGIPGTKFYLARSTYFNDGDPTTAQLTQPNTYTFQSGKMGESSNPLSAIDLETDRYTELEWCLKASDETEDGEVYEFRVTIAGTPLDEYSYTPRWTIGVYPTYYVVLQIMSILVPVIGKTLYFFRSLPATEQFTPAMAKILNWVKSLSVTEISISNLLGARYILVAISAVMTSVVNLFKLISFMISLNVAEVSQTILNRLATYYRSLSVISVEVATLNLIKTFYKTLSAMGTSIATLMKGIYKTLSIAESSIVSLSAKQLNFVIMSAIEISISILNGIITKTKILSVMEISLAELSKLVSYFRSLIATGVGLASLFKLVSYFRSLVAVEVSLTSLYKASTYFKILSVVESSIANLYKGMYKLLSAIGYSIADIPWGRKYKVSLIVTVISRVSFTIWLFIRYFWDVERRWWKIIRRISGI